MTNITVRIDEDVKNEAETLFAKLGMSISGAINVFFRQAIREQAIPFPIRAATREEKYREEKYDEYFNPYNMKILRESMAQSERGEVITFTMDELIAMEDGEIPQRALDFMKAHNREVGGK